MGTCEMHTREPRLYWARVGLSNGVPYAATTELVVSGCQCRESMWHDLNADSERLPIGRDTEVVVGKAIPPLYSEPRIMGVNGLTP